MATSVEVRNIRGEAVRVVADGELVDVPAGGTVKVTPEAAGRPPSWRKVRDGDDVDFLEVRREGGDVVEVHDLGEGLLAQTENWAPATPPAKPTPEQPPVAGTKEG